MSVVVRAVARTTTPNTATTPLSKQGASGVVFKHGTIAGSDCTMFDRELTSCYTFAVSTGV